MEVHLVQLELRWFPAVFRPHSRSKSLRVVSFFGEFQSTSFKFLLEKEKERINWIASWSWCSRSTWTPRGWLSFTATLQRRCATCGCEAFLRVNSQLRTHQVVDKCKIEAMYPSADIKATETLRITAPMHPLGQRTMFSDNINYATLTIAALTLRSALNAPDSGWQNPAAFTHSELLANTDRFDNCRC